MAHEATMADDQAPQTVPETPATPVDPDDAARETPQEPRRSTRDDLEWGEQTKWRGGISFGLFSRRDPQKPDTDVPPAIALSAGFFAVTAVTFGTNADLTDVRGWGAVVASGLLVAYTYAIITKALEVLEPQKVNMINASEAPLGLLWMAILVGVLPTPNELFGATLLLLAVLWETRTTRDVRKTK